jgi:hypothetical protein
VDDRTKTANRNFERAAAVGKTAVQDAQVRYTAAMEDLRDLNMKLVEMARASTEAALEAGAAIANAKNPGDLAHVWSTHAAKQFAILTDQARELTGIWQKFLAPPR